MHMVCLPLQQLAVSAGTDRRVAEQLLGPHGGPKAELGAALLLPHVAAAGCCWCPGVAVMGWHDGAVLP